ncbi:MAG: serine--tRNA ligase [Bacteroidetes bacterium]|nr:serine--tRNA ligase [Bacteroidota bacterium]
MLLVKYLREHTKEAIEGLSKRKLDAEGLIKDAINADDERIKLQQEKDEVLSESNQISSKIGDLYSKGEKDEAEKLKTESKVLKEKAGVLEESFTNAEARLKDILMNIPNIPHGDVPAGKGDEDNEIFKEAQNMPDNIEGVPHWELAEEYNLIDFELGSKITGAGFPVYLGQGAKLQRALINFFLDSAVKEGYTEIEPPLMVNEESAFATGQLPDKEGQMYHVPVDNLYLIPTAEVPLTNLYRNVILNEDQFPIKLTGYTPCFRREAGSYGKDVKGLNRIHQFDKVEIVQIQHPNESYKILDEMRDYVENLLQQLELPYRILKLCGGDLGTASAFTYDMEVYSGAQEKWLEVSSISNFESYQANRLKLRFKDKESKKTQLAHTLNGSALALPRIVASLLENNQSKEGIKVPKVLHNYTNFDMILKSNS